MIQHVMLPFLDLSSAKPVKSDVREYLENECSRLQSSIDNSVSSVSMFINQEIAMSILNKDNRINLGKFEKQLVSDGECKAYSEGYAKLLHKSENQWLQMDTYTEYCHWMISNLNGIDNQEDKSKLIMKYANDEGLFYNSENSQTELRYRMKTEYLCQTLMALEIISINQSLKKRLSETIVNSKMNPYISAEYYKMRICEKLGIRSSYQTKQNIQLLISRCKADVGLCDFDSQNKTDDFMGSKKRTARDQTLFSPISTLQGVYLCKRVGLNDLAGNLIHEAYHYYISNSIFIPAFKMRDIDIPFGPGESIPEIAALHTLIILFETL